MAFTRNLCQSFKGIEGSAIRVSFQMNDPFIITSRGKLVKNDWVYRNHKLFQGNLPKTRYLMDKATWDDIVKWSNEQEVK